MVDFNNETTVSTPAGDVVKILILQRRNDLIESIEAYNKARNSGVLADTSIVKARLLSLFFEVQPALERNKNDGDLEEINLLVLSDDYKDLVRGFLIINRWLDETKLIRIDTKKQYDRRIAEEENKQYKV